MTESGAGDARDRPGASIPLSTAARRARLIAALALVAALALGVRGLLTGPTEAPVGRASGVTLLALDREFPASGRYPSDPYIGPRACAECHPGESALHARSGHARTLRPAGRRALARALDGKAVADPERPDVRWSYRYRDGQLSVRREEAGRVEEAIAEYAFGSGYHATTFVNLVDARIPEILEHRLTYYTRSHALGVTPGQDARPRPPHLTTLGAVFSARAARKCFGCHATQVARDDRTIDEATLIPGVSCERCHGPGRAHVEAARAGKAGEALDLPFGPGRYTSESLLTLCGTCHRHPSRARPEQLRPDDPHLARFQPVGILASRCFRESGGAPSCVTCHDPHARPSSDRASYRDVCLSCHPGPPPSDSGVAGAPCPVSPRGDCVDCHMPRVEAGQHVLFADHWIRVRRPGEAALPLRGPPPDLRPLDAPDP